MMFPYLDLHLVGFSSTIMFDDAGIFVEAVEGGWVNDQACNECPLDIGIPMFCIND